MTKEEKKALIVQMKLAKKTADELIAIYKAWDYKFKPEYSIFLHAVMESSTKPSFVKYLLEVRAIAYYTQSHSECDYAFKVLACLIHIAVIEQIETPFDHVINSDKDFEWKLNNLFEKKQQNEETKARTTQRHADL
jgi:uncharacterized protein YueI